MRIPANFYLTQLAFPLIQPTSEANKTPVRNLGKIREEPPRFWWLRVVIQSTKCMPKLRHASLSLTTQLSL